MRRKDAVDWGTGAARDVLGFHRGGGRNHRRREQPSSLSRPHSRKGPTVIDFSALSNCERKFTTSDGGGWKRGKDFTVAVQTSDPDSFAPLRPPGWLGSLWTFIGRIVLSMFCTLGTCFYVVRNNIILKI
jgi:hypothetical protein